MKSQNYYKTRCTELEELLKKNENRKNLLSQLREVSAVDVRNKISKIKTGTAPKDTSDSPQLSEKASIAPIPRLNEMDSPVYYLGTNETQMDWGSVSGQTLRTADSPDLTTEWNFSDVSYQPAAPSQLYYDNESVQMDSVLRFSPSQESTDYSCSHLP